jgi:hypothetical protein
MKVHSVLGCGFQEVIYQRAMAKSPHFRLSKNQRKVLRPVTLIQTFQ